MTKASAVISSPPSVKGARYVAIGSLNQAPWNARKSFDPASLEELAESIRQKGVLSPLIVRPEGISQDEEAIYEIVCGHRRFAAAQRAGLGEVPCIIRDLDDHEAQEVALVDNLQRENVPAMEEAVAFSELLTRLGSIESVAARVQKQQSYLAQRLKLCSLSLAGQDALRHRLITVDHALVLARLGADEQDAALKWCLDLNAGVKISTDAVIEARVKRQHEAEKARAEEGNSHRWRHTWEPQSVQELKDHIASESGIVLDRAPWDLDSATLIPDAAACNACPQNTKANAPLFGDLEIGEAKCTDTGCFKEKTQAFVQLRLKEAEPRAADMNGRSTVRVSWKLSSTPPRFLKGFASLDAKQEFTKDTPDPKQVFKAGQWIEVKKKSCDSARAAVTVDWADGGYRGELRKPGEIVQVCIEPKCKAHPKEWAKPKSKAGSGTRNENSPEARAELEKREAQAKAENELRKALLAKAIDGVQRLSSELLRKILLMNCEAFYDYDKHFPGGRKALKTAKVDSADFARAAVGLLVVDDNAPNLWADEYGAVDQGRKDFIALLKDLGYDASKAWDKPKADLVAKSAKTKPVKKGVLSTEGRKRIAAAQKKRWAAAVTKKGGR